MYEKVYLNNGICVVYEKIDYFKSVSVGIWFKAGSMYEEKNENGLSHFIEHMLFKGTTSRTAKMIAQEIDAVGGQLNAFTGKDCTCYYCSVISEHIDLAFNILSDMILHSVFSQPEIDREKGVISEEISMYADSPEDVVYDLFAEKVFSSHPLGQPVLGNQYNIQSFDRQRILDFFYKYYAPSNMVISIAGNFNEKKLFELIDLYFGRWENSGNIKIAMSKPQYKNGVTFRYKSIEQMHLCMGYPAPSLGDDIMYPLMIFNNILGGGTSSRLFQKIREDRGLVYSIYSYPAAYTCGGIFTICASMNLLQTSKVIELIFDEIEDIIANGLTAEELKMSQEQLKGNYILGMESTSSHMSAIGRSELLLNRVLTSQEILHKIDNVSIDDVLEVIDNIFVSSKVTIAMVGKDDKVLREIEKIV
jgi:predicted Zn-dependent peptidase